ncbi:MAG: hypothetical protein ACE5GX_16580 [Thermoanaerobaculia bacterium]
MGRKRKRKTARSRASEATPVAAMRWRSLPWLAMAAGAVFAVVAIGALLQDESAAVASPIEFSDVKQQTREFIGYYNSIKLTPEQELIKRQALSKVPAPCCSDNSAYTCCCPCNMAKTWWGLSHHLIVDEGYGADGVRAAVEGWIDFINPKGFSGDACYKGGCVRPFHRNGCGGMSEKQIVF